MKQRPADACRELAESKVHGFFLCWRDVAEVLQALWAREHFAHGETHNSQYHDPDVVKAA